MESGENVKHQPLDKEVRLSAAKGMMFGRCTICRRWVLMVTHLLYLHEVFGALGMVEYLTRDIFLMSVKNSC